MHTLDVMRNLIFYFIISAPILSFAASSELETKKTYIEDIFIWRMSDELNLSAGEEKKFTEIHKDLNKKKSDLNKEIQEITQSLSSPDEAKIKYLRKKIQNYNQISIEEFDSMKKLLGTKKFSAYLQVKSDLTNRVKSLLSGEKTNEKEKKEGAVKLPPPQVIIEK